MSNTTTTTNKKKAAAGDDALFFTKLSKDFPLVPLLLIGLASIIGQYHPTSFADLAFVVLYPSYLLIANYVRFQNNQPANQAGKIHQPLVRNDETDTQMNNLHFLQIYVGYLAFVGLIGPAVLLIAAPSNVAAAAAPHLYLLLWQMAMEGLTDQPTYAPYIRILVPIGFSIYRMGILVTWVTKMVPIAIGIIVMEQQQQVVVGREEEIWIIIGAMLAILNLVSWSYNLFVFLLLRMTPAYLDPVEYPCAKVEWKVGQLVPMPVRRNSSER